jgi:iron(II)-dependent oxidoreductase
MTGMNHIPIGTVTAITAESRPQAVKVRAAQALDAARRRTLALTECLDEHELTARHSPLTPPLVWDMAHIANQEEIWLLREAGGRPALRGELDTLYNTVEQPRATRAELPLLGPDAARAYLAQVRIHALEVLSDAPVTGSPLFQDGFVFGMVAQHEQQHDETMLATHQLRHGPAVLHAPPPEPAATPVHQLPSEVLVPAGDFTMGTSTDPWALDHERPAHTVDVPAFWLDTTPVSNAAYQEFIADGGYAEPLWWHPEGWKHRQHVGMEAPLFWQRDGDTWLRRRFGRTEEVPPDEPVVHVCWYEGDAYARWAGRRLPTEAEWEKAARHDPATGRSWRNPWGEWEADSWHANIGQHHLQPAPVGSYPTGVAPCRARQLLGDVWEWTSSDFTGYPGFRAFPHREHSEVFFGPQYKVLRGGSFATGPTVCRATFRNWDFPVRRQIFAGFRTVRDVDGAPRMKAA